MSLARLQLKTTDTAALDASPLPRKLLFIFTYLAGLVSIQVLHLALDDLKLNLALSCGLSAGFVYAYYLEPRWRAITTYTVSLIATLLSGYYTLTLWHDQAMLGNYLGILLGILTVLLAFKAFSPSDHRFVLMVLWVFFVYSSVASYDLRFMLLLPLYLAFAGSSMYVANQVDVALRVAGTAVAQTPGKPGSVARRLLGGFELDRGYVWVLVRAILGVLVLSVVAYLFTPHAGSGSNYPIINASPRVDEPGANDAEQLNNDQNRGQGSGQAELGVGDNFDLTDTRRLSDETRPVLQMKTNRNGYLRAKVYDVYTGSGWLQSRLMTQGLIGLRPQDVNFQPSSDESNTFAVPVVDFPSQSVLVRLSKGNNSLDAVAKNIFSDNQENNIEYDLVRQEIKLLDSQPPYYFSIFQPYRLENISLLQNGRRLDMPVSDIGATIRAATLGGSHPQSFSYTVLSLAPRVSRTALAQVVSPGPSKIVTPYTQLPLEENPSDDTLGALGIDRAAYRPITSRLRNFALGLTTPKPDALGQIQPPSQLDKVKAIESFLGDNNEFTYTRQFKPIEAGQEITEAFVLGTQEGFCRYYASAMAVLCRINGIPARVISGYAPGTYSIVDGAYVVEAANAHAWVEVYFDGYGWLPFDPTPVGSGSGASKAGELIGRLFDAMQDLFVIDPAASRQAVFTFFAELGRAALANLPVTIALALVILIACIGNWLWCRFSRKARAAPLVPENQVITAYLEARRLLARLGLKASPGTTARGLLDLARTAYPTAGDPLADLVPVYERAAFAPQPLTGGDMEQAQGALDRIRASVEAEMMQKKRRK